MRAYPVSMSVQKLLAAFAAFAMLLAPAFSSVGEAFAAVPDDHHAQMMESGHCQSAPSKSDEHDKARDTGCCISMCMAVAVTPPAPLEGVAPAPATAVSAIPPLHVPYLAEIATPPPKVG